MKGVYKRKDLTGQRVGKLLVLRELGKRHHNHRVYLCQCDCGKEIEVIHANLNSKNTKSCGCLVALQHGLYKHPLYNKWVGMHNRCNKKYDISYKYYGGRGIKVDTRWNLFRNFLDDMLPTYFEGATLDRINNESPYCKENCRWASIAEQNRNKTTNIILEINGEKRILAEWSRYFGVKQSTVEWRYRRGWQHPRLFVKPKSRLHNQERNNK